MDTHILQTQLEQYAARKLYPLHMPGHKRRVQPAPGLPVALDVTEVPGTDDLHCAEGILLEAMKRTARLCEADRTWYLVNGSTCGLLAGVRALAERGSEVICARNCHKAVYYAIELAGYRVHWIMPRLFEDWGICRGISADQVESALRRHPSARAVILTSPTYEGILSDIEEICGICHKRRIPVLVDEAHGAHLIPASARAGFPAGAVSAGADLVVQSPHKTLPSLTQTALLHMNGCLLDPARIEAELDIFETSSPSYLLMASLDGCTGILREQGAELFSLWADRLKNFDREVGGKLHYIRIFGHTQEVPGGCVTDPGKILIDAAPIGMTGRELADILRRRCQLETEMSGGSLVLAMTSVCDDEEALKKLARALLQIETEAARGSRKAASAESKKKRRRAGTDTDMSKTAGSAAAAAGDGLAGKKSPAADFQPVVCCTAAEARGQQSEEVPAEQAQGRICAEYLYFYPPGIPFLAPGEMVTSSVLRYLREEQEGGRNLYNHRSGDHRSGNHKSGNGFIRCLRE